MMVEMVLFNIWVGKLLGIVDTHVEDFNIFVVDSTCVGVCEGNLGGCMWVDVCARFVCCMQIYVKSNW